MMFQLNTPRTPWCHFVPANKEMYGYTVKVREGRPGFADDDEYTQGGFETFLEAIHSLLHFNPVSYWSNLRRVQRRIIYKKNSETVYNYTDIDVRSGYIHFLFDDDIVWANEMKLINDTPEPFTFST